MLNKFGEYEGFRLEMAWALSRDSSQKKVSI